MGEGQKSNKEKSIITGQEEDNSRMGSISPLHPQISMLSFETAFLFFTRNRIVNRSPGTPIGQQKEVKQFWDHLQFGIANESFFLLFSEKIRQGLANYITCFCM